MPAYEAILVHVPTFLVVLARVGGLFLLAPVLSSAMIPRQYKVLLILILSVSVYPVIDHEAAAAVRMDLFGLAPAIAGEMLIGAVIGLIALLPLVAVQLGGVVMGQQMGMGLAQVVNPAIDIEGDAIGQMLFMAALAGFVALGGIELMFSATIETFARVPPGAATLGMAPLELLTGMLSSAYVLAVRIALPVLAILTLESVASAIVMKTVPSINVMTVGFPIRVVVGLMVLVASLTVIHATVLEEIRHGLDVIVDWSRSIEPATP